MRIIDADALKADYGMKDDCADCEKELQGKVRSCEYDRIYSKMDFCGWIDDAPTIDAVEVVRTPVVGYEGYYEVDNCGRVYALDRVIHVEDHGRSYDKTLKGGIIKQHMHSNGYKIVPLTKDGKTKNVYVHRLVAMAFLPNPGNLPFVNHKDEDKTNNFVENLEWCSEQYNTTYGKAREKQAKALRGRHLTEEHRNAISNALKRYFAERRIDDSV